MTYKHLTIDELTMIESYYLQHNKPVEIANRMGRAIQTIYNVVNKFKQGKTALDYWHQYKENKKKCGRKVIQLPAHEVEWQQFFVETSASYFHSRLLFFCQQPAFLRRKFPQT